MPEPAADRLPAEKARSHSSTHPSNPRTASPPWTVEVPRLDPQAGFGRPDPHRAPPSVPGSASRLPSSPGQQPRLTSGGSNHLRLHVGCEDDAGHGSGGHNGQCAVSTAEIDDIQRVSKCKLRKHAARQTGPHTSFRPTCHHDEGSQACALLTHPRHQRRRAAPSAAGPCLAHDPKLRITQVPRGAPPRRPAHQESVHATALPRATWSPSQNH